MNNNSELSNLIRMQPEEVYGPEIDLSVFIEEEPTQEHWSVGFPSDFVVVGHDGEYADMSNPTGAIIRERFSVVAEDALGHRRTWGGMYDSEAAAEAAYSLLAPAVAFWNEIRPAYGSEAYAANWEEYQAEDRADEMASDFLNFRYEC